MREELRKYGKRSEFKVEFTKEYEIKRAIIERIAILRAKIPWDLLEEHDPWVRDQIEALINEIQALVYKL